MGEEHTIWHDYSPIGEDIGVSLSYDLMEDEIADLLGEDLIILLNYNPMGEIRVTLLAYTWISKEDYHFNLLIYTPMGEVQGILLIYTPLWKD